MISLMLSLQQKYTNKMNTQKAVNDAFKEGCTVLGKSFIPKSPITLSNEDELIKHVTEELKL